MKTHTFAPVQKLGAGALLRRHQHSQSYAAVVLSGAYEEMGSSGRSRVLAGDIVLHSAFEAHVNRVGQRGAKVLNLPLPMGAVVVSTVVTSNRLDEVVHLAGAQPLEAASLLLQSCGRVERSAACNAADELALAVQRNPALRIDVWAADSGISRFRLSREFSLHYGVWPARYRAEVRAHKAWRGLIRGSGTLADLALDTGYCDQAHMCHAIRMLTGRSPSHWRTHIHTSHLDPAPVFHSYGTSGSCDEET